ncbi:hypothetical protein L873DRAFT_1792352 [Choiromyces venosus 120613-1]|uniref:Uncharacterized protein n=1 Tax=Choiromyces venosus 120613-1 TaxID=1336337 RepID=A0A3N4JG02_9PEZI|nr:hypothetical protein L873DRAFT_1792352 [Choiromyces venosus 120613-1]
MEKGCEREERKRGCEVVARKRSEGIRLNGMSLPDSQTEKINPPPGHLPQVTTETKSPLANTPTQKKPTPQSTNKIQPTHDQSSSLGAPQYLADTQVHRLDSPNNQGAQTPTVTEKEM